MLHHVIGLLAGAVLAPALWLALGWSGGQVSPALDGGGSGTPPALTAVAVLMIAGLACGFMASARISPLAALICGGLVLGYALWPIMAPGSLANALPGWVPTDSLFHPRGPGLVLALPLGTLLFISGVVPSRWRSRREPDPYPQPIAPPPADAVAAEPRGPEPAEPPLGDPDKTTTPMTRERMTRRRMGRPRWKATSPEPASDTLEFERDEPR
ncbi:hypothetical protein GCM10027570_36010 [Streptomonospora sediminis]